LHPQPTNPHDNKPAKTNPECRCSTSPPAPTPTIPLHAPVANEWAAVWNRSHKQTWAEHLNGVAKHTQVEKPFTTIECKKKKTPTTVIPKALPCTNREVIITLGEKVTNQATMADQALQAINKVIKESTDITQPPFILAHITNNNRLVLTTNPTTKASDYTPYLQIITNAAQLLKLTETRINECWTKFLLHNVPTNADPPAVRSEIEDTYPSLRLRRDPCWLIPTEHRTNKVASTLVISLIGNIDYKCLGISQLAICNPASCILFLIYANAMLEVQHQPTQELNISYVDNTSFLQSSLSLRFTIKRLKEQSEHHMDRGKHLGLCFSPPKSELLHCLPKLSKDKAKDLSQHPPLIINEQTISHS
jgi:hypothetical protein